MVKSFHVREDESKGFWRVAHEAFFLLIKHYSLSIRQCVFSLKATFV